VQEILKFDEDESLVLILLNDLNIDSWGFVSTFYDANKLSDKMNF
jgi:hypothetical protein